MKAIISLIVVAVCIGMFVLYVGPTWAEVGVLQAKKSQYTQTLEKSKELRVQRDTIEAAYTAITPADFERLDKIIPETFDPVLVVKDLSDIASTYGMQVKGTNIVQDVLADSSNGVVVVATDAPKPYRTTTVTFHTEGSYEQFTKFLKDIELNLRTADLMSLSLKASSQKSGVGFQYDVTLQMYSLK